MICFHHNDLDGSCSAAIVHRWVSGGSGDERYVELDYKDRVPVEEIQLGERIYIVDFSFKPEVMEEVFKRTHYVIWIDHHKTAAAYVYSREVPGLRDFEDKKWAACELTWQYCFPGKPMPEAVSLIGDYDKWALKTQPRCFRFYEGLKLLSSDPTAPFWQDLFGDHSEEPVRAICEQGVTAIEYRDSYCAGMRKSYGFEVELDGHRGFATNIYGFGSNGFGPELMERYDFCSACIFDGKRWTVSLYSEKIDVGEICKKLGGGGHRGAAGFQVYVLPWRSIGAPIYVA